MLVQCYASSASRAASEPLLEGHEVPGSLGRHLSVVSASLQCLVHSTGRQDSKFQWRIVRRRVLELLPDVASKPHGKRAVIVAVANYSRISPMRFKRECLVLKTRRAIPMSNPSYQTPACRPAVSEVLHGPLMKQTYGMRLTPKAMNRWPR